MEIASKQEALNNEFPEDEISVQLDQNGEDSYTKIGQFFHTTAEIDHETQRENYEAHEEENGYNVF